MKELRVFDNIANLVRLARLNHVDRYSQTELSHLLGYRNGQFVSNIERGVCGVPLRMYKKIQNILNIPYVRMKEASIKDFSESLDAYQAETNGDEIPEPPTKSSQSK